MFEYIDRCAVMANMQASINAAHEDNTAQGDLIADAFEAMQDLVFAFPAADVVPVRHGRLVKTEMYFDDYAWVCSVCGEPWTLIEGTPSDNNMNFCPNCGAKMDGAKETENEE